MMTVLTTVRNGMPYLAETVASVRGQTLPDVEHCVVDDGSTDGTTDFLKRPENAGLRVLANPPVGRGRALNLGWRSCTTDLVAILDADDTASPRWLAEMMAIMASHPQIAVLSCRGVLAQEDMDDAPARPELLARLTPQQFLARNPVHHSGTLIRRTALEAVGGYAEVRPSLFDYDLWVRLLAQGAEIWCLDQGYVYKRIHAGQHFEARRRLQYLVGCFEIRRRVSTGLLGGCGAWLPYATFVYGLLPQGFRHWFRHWRYHRPT